MDDHPLAAIFPEMSKEDFARLRDDIHSHGLRRPITLFEGKILDGRHRHRACIECGVQPRFDQFADGDAGQFVIAENLARRHLTPSQIAMVSLNYEAVERERAKERMAAGAGYHHVVVPETGNVAEKLGKKFGVGENTVQRAIKVKRDGVPELVDRVRDGEMTVSEAAKVATLGKDSQRRIVNMPKEERKKAMGKAIAISKSKKARNPPPVVEAAGTEFTRALLGRVELIANDLSSRGLRDRQMILDRFVGEFGWGDKVQLQQLWHCMETLRLLGDLYRVASEKSRAA